MSNARTDCICITCQKPFWVYNSLIRRDGKRLYCSMACRKFLGADNPRYKADEGWVSCKGCGTSFKVKPSSLKAGKAKAYCTSACRENAEGKRQKTCGECGKEYLVFNCYAERSKHCSRSCASIAAYRVNGQMNKGVQRGRGGKVADLGGLYVRSSWEANYARYLNHKVAAGEIIKWEFEPDTFNFPEGTKPRFYTPDFKIWLPDGGVEYHEVKGWLDEKSIRRAQAMKAHYPQTKITIIDKTWFRLNGKNLSLTVPNWIARIY